MSKLKEFKIDLGGEFPSKSEAVQRRAFDLGWGWHYGGQEITEKDKRFLLFYKEKDITYCRYPEDFQVKKFEQISAERFLELTKEDVTLQEPTLYYRYRIWFKDGEIRDVDYFCEINGDRIECLSGKKHMVISDTLKYERIGEGVEKDPRQA